MAVSDSALGAAASALKRVSAADQKQAQKTPKQLLAEVQRSKAVAEACNVEKWIKGQDCLAPSSLCAK
jgi:hypothetical protein